jgi:Amt family ammonium transporter
MIWGEGGLLYGKAIDYAGGTVIHISAGVAGLVAALMLGKRKGYPGTPMPPHSLVLTVIGASMLWVGWFGFNAGSALAADGVAGLAMANTQIAAAAAALVWMFAEWLLHKKASVLGIISGAVAGLVAITPACAFVTPSGALAIGILAGLICFWAVVVLKQKLGYDDALDVFGIHGVGGIVGAVATGIFAIEAAGGSAGLLDGNAGQVAVQIYGIATTIVWSAIASFVLLKVIDLIIGLRVERENEIEGLDITLHGEVVQ